MALLLWGCSSAPENFADRPVDLIPQETMVQVVTDINLLEAHISEVRLIGMLNRDSSEKYYNQLFQKHGIERKQLESSLDYYATQIGELDTIYAQSLRKLAAMDEALDVELNDKPLQYVDKMYFVNMLQHDSLLPVFEDSLDVVQAKDSLMKRVRAYPETMDTITFREFAFSYTFYCSNPSKYDAIKAMVLKDTTYLSE